MERQTRILLAVALAAPFAALTGCTEREPRNERWVTTQNTTVPIDWDRVNEAYRQANGPEDLERRINEIYPGDEVISVAVADVNNTTQEVTGFFDRNTSGAVDEGERVFTIRRVITGEGTAQMQTVGHGAYGFYHSPLLSIASGMLLGSMLSRAFSPGYVPMYSRPYVTPPSRVGAISQWRSGWRASNPSYRGAAPGAYRNPPMSGSGRSYGGGPRSSFPRGGGRFGVRRGGRPAPVRLDA